MRVDDYSEEEIQEDITLVDWDYAYNEILKIEERKISKFTKEADKRVQQEKQRLEEELRIKFEEEQQKNLQSLQ